MLYITFLKLKKHPGKDFPFEKFIDAIERKSEITGFIARLNINGVIWLVKLNYRN